MSDFLYNLYSYCGCPIHQAFAAVAAEQSRIHAEATDEPFTMDDLRLALREDTDESA